MLLIFPPAAKACEPPAGIARLAAVLRSRTIPCHLLDANLEAQLWLLQQPCSATDTWSRRAFRHHASHLNALRSADTYASIDRYTRAVRDLNRLLSLAGGGGGASTGLADYQDRHLSPVRSQDLLQAAEQPHLNPFYPWFAQRLPEAIGNSGHTAVIGFSLNYLSQALCTFAMIGFLRQQAPGLTIVLGGGLVTSWLSRPGWHSPFAGLVDHLVPGDGEEFLLALSGATAGPHVAPDYSTLPLADYLSPGLILPYSTAGGCYWNRCSFCPERAEGSRYRPAPVHRALSDLHHLARHHRPVLLHLLDSALSPLFLQKLTEQPPGIPWYGFARFGPELADPDVCRALRDSGCVMLKLGLESGDQTVLDQLGKGIDLAVASQALMNLRRAGIATYLYLLFGTPAEAEPAARRTLEFVVKHQEAIGFLNLAIFNMPLDGEEAPRYATDPFYAGDLSLYTGFSHPLGWNRPRVRAFLEKEFKRHPAVAAILRRDPPVFTSNHASLFVPAIREAGGLGTGLRSR